MARTAKSEKLSIKMLNDRVLVDLNPEGERRSSGGILIPATAENAKGTEAQLRPVFAHVSGTVRAAARSGVSVPQVIDRGRWLRTRSNRMGS